MKKLFLILCLCAMMFYGCEKDDFCNCLEGKGSDITETRSLADFNILEMDNNVDIVLSPDSVNYALLTCGKNLADGITTEVIDGRLVVKNLNRCNWLRDFRNKFTLEIHYKNIGQIVNYGSGNLSCADTVRDPVLFVESWNGTGTLSFLLNNNEVYFKLHTGPGDIHASGISKYQYIYTAGNGFIKSAHLETDITHVNTKSTGDCEVNSKLQLAVNIEYNGNVYYKGEPEINQHITGNGSLIPF